MTCVIAGKTPGQELVVANKNTKGAAKTTTAGVKGSAEVATANP